MSILEAERAYLEKILHSPRLPDYAREIEKAMEREAQKRKEFYREITDDDKAEFINGEIVYHSPVLMRHNSALKRLLAVLIPFVQLGGLGYVGIEKVMISLTRNDYEPDICFFGPEKAAEFTATQMHFPAPDFIVEILSDSTEKNDRGVKFVDYAAHGVGEYWIVDPTAETVEQYRLTGDGFDLVLKVKDGSIESLVIPGFKIPVRAVFDDSESRAALQQLL